MFGKCLKYELRAYSRLLVPTFIALMIASVLMSVAVGVLTSLMANTANEMIQVIAGMLLYFIVMAVYLAMFIIPVMVFVLTIRRFYTSFFTDEGYLTFTLPVSVDCHLTSKLAAAAIADIFGLVTAILSVIIIGSGAAIANIDILKSLFSGFEFSEMSVMLGYLGLDSVVTVILVLVAMVLSILGNYLLLYLSISFGCMLAKKHRFIVCGACYLGVSTVVSVISSVVSTVVMFLVAAAFTQTQAVGVIFNIILAIVSVFVAIEVVACYFITRYILKNKVNLD
ncbi:MAG: hypothetical protein IJX55_03765 [Clostridia bacterium]|nr:hypothetical protein [Clostridia bacterium]